MLKADDIRSMTIDEIDSKVDALKKDHYVLRVQAKTGKLEKQHRIKELKKDIARLLTIRKQLVASDANKKK